MADRPSERKLWRSLLAGFIYIALSSQAQADAVDDEFWPTLQQAFFAGKDVEDGSQLIQMTAPAVAEDAGLVPISIAIDTFHSFVLQVAKIYLIIDANPVQLTANPILNQSPPRKEHLCARHCRDQRWQILPA